MADRAFWVEGPESLIFSSPYPEGLDWVLQTHLFLRCLQREEGFGTGGFGGQRMNSGGGIRNDAGAGKELNHCGRVRRGELARGK